MEIEGKMLTEKEFNKLKERFIEKEYKKTKINKQLIEKCLKVMWDKSGNIPYFYTDYCDDEEETIDYEYLGGFN